MASSVSGQDEPNPALWLATRAGKMELSCPVGETAKVQHVYISAASQFNSNPALFGWLDSFAVTSMVCTGMLWWNNALGSLFSEHRDLSF